MLYVVVPGPMASAEKGKPVVLWEGAIGEPNKKKWQRDYAQFAHAKAAVTFRTGMPAHKVLRDFPHLYKKGDFKFGGSEIRNGIIVAASGLDWHFDFMVSGAIAAMCHGLCLRVAEANCERHALHWREGGVAKNASTGGCRYQRDS